MLYNLNFRPNKKVWVLTQINRESNYHKHHHHQFQYNILYFNPLFPSIRNINSNLSSPLRIQKKWRYLINKSEGPRGGRWWEGGGLGRGITRLSEARLKVLLNLTKIDSALNEAEFVFYANIQIF